MTMRSIFLIATACATIGTSAFADGWSHSFSRGFDLYLSGTDQAGIRLVCDSDTDIRKGSFLEVRTTLRRDEDNQTYRLAIGGDSYALSGASGFLILFKNLTPKAHAGLARAFARAKTIQIRSGADALSEVSIGSARPVLCD